MSLYADYVHERTHRHVLETPHAFCTYEISGQECYIVDIYVKPEFRKSKVASELANLVAVKAKLAGCKFLTGSVSPKAKGATDSLKVLLSYGFNLLRSTEDLIYFVKGI